MHHVGMAKTVSKCNNHMPSRKEILRCIVDIMSRDEAESYFVDTISPLV